MDRLLDKYIEQEVKKMSITDKLTGFLVKKKRRGTFQALEESKEIEEELTEKIVEYIHKWLLDEFIEGGLKDKLSKEIQDAVHLELARLGYDKILKKSV